MAIYLRQIKSFGQSPRFFKAQTVVSTSNPVLLETGIKDSNAMYRGDILDATNRGTIAPNYSVAGSGIVS